MAGVLRHISAFFEKWRYFGLSCEHVAICRRAMNRHNASGLTVISVVTACIFVLLSFYPASVYRNPFVYYGFAFFQIFIFGYNQYLLRRKVQSSIPYVLSIVFYSASVLGFSLYVCLFDQGIYTIRFLLFFLSLEIAFVFSAFFSLLYNFAIVALFFLCYSYSQLLFGINMAIDSGYDVLNVLACCLIAMTMNWHISHVFLKSVIAAHALKEERNRYHEQSIRDQLTGLNNRRSFEQSVGFYTSVCRHVHQTVCVIMMDIDFFKNYNDNYGHHCGDIVLQTVGKILQRIIEDERVYAARVGGEEFIVLWTENRTSEAERVALKLRQMIIDERMPHDFSQVAPYVTASLGLYIMRGGSKDSAEELYHKADVALYKAKETGRNRVVCFDSEDGVLHEIELRDYTSISR